MTRKFDIVRIVAMALVAVAILGVVTPVCTMPGCDDVAADTCSDFTPACDDCPDQLLMKHSHDEAISTATVEIDAPAALVGVVALPEPPAPAIHVTAPEVTTSPPPLDPLGVRLTV
jgi:hypothetical protein